MLDLFDVRIRYEGVTESWENIPISMTVETEGGDHELENYAYHLFADDITLSIEEIEFNRQGTTYVRIFSMDKEGYIFDQEGVYSRARQLEDALSVMCTCHHKWDTNFFQDIPTDGRVKIVGTTCHDCGSKLFIWLTDSQILRINIELGGMNVRKI